jgi:hypothetical protein
MDKATKTRRDGAVMVIAGSNLQSHKNCCALFFRAHHPLSSNPHINTLGPPGPNDDGLVSCMVQLAFACAECGGCGSHNCISRGVGKSDGDIKGWRK